MDNSSLLIFFCYIYLPLFVLFTALKFLSTGLLPIYIGLCILMHVCMDHQGFEFIASSSSTILRDYVLVTILYIGRYIDQHIFYQIQKKKFLRRNNMDWITLIQKESQQFSNQTRCSYRYVYM